MILLATFQLWSRGLPAGATSALARSTTRISQLGEPATQPLLSSFRPLSPLSSRWPRWAQLPINDLGDYFPHSPDPVP